MQVIQTILTVKGDEALERAIAADVTSMDDNDFTHNFLEQMSTEYPHYKGKKTTVVENWDEQGGQDFNASTIEKDSKQPQND